MAIAKAVIHQLEILELMAATLITSPPRLAFAEDPIYVTLESDEISGGAPLQDNLLGYVEVWEDAATDVNLINLHSPYDLSSQETTFNIAKAFNLAPHLPGESTMFWTGGIGVTQAVGAWKKYFLRYADKYGIPPTTPGLNQSDTEAFYVIHGAQSVAQRGTWNNGLDELLLCHNYIRRDGQQFIKPSYPDQPDWLFFWLDDTQNIRLDVTFHKIDGTESTITLYDPPTDLTGPALYYVETGYYQNQLEATYAPELVSGYTYKILNLSGGKSLQLKYVFDCECHSYPFYLLAFNGLGGVESIYLKGKIREDIESTRSDFERTRWTDLDLKEGLQGQYDSKRQRVFTVNTGWYDEYYIEHLQSVLLGDLWQIDLDNGRFLKLTIDTKNIRIRESDQQLFSLEFRIRYAWKDPYFTLY